MLELATSPGDAQFLRAVSMRDILRRFGKVLTDQQGSEETFELSYPVRQIDTFLSHAWSTPGAYKTIALLYYANKDRALVVTFTLAAIMWGLEIASVLPNFMSWQSFYIPGKDRIHSWSATYDYAPLCVVFVVVLLFGQEIPFVPRRQCFLDKCCIHQTDLLKKKAGVQLLGQFLQSSQKLLILWQPEYLTRLWCVYELAAFRHIKGSNKGLITFLPLKLPMLTIGLFFFHTAATTLLELTMPWMVNSKWHSEFVMDNISAEHRPFYWAFICYTLLFVNVYLVVGFFLWRFCVSHVRDRQTLLYQLRTFTLDKTECKYEYDRIFVESQIREWFGSLGAFEREVQTEVAELVEQQLAAKEAMPWSMIFVGALSHVFFTTSICIDHYQRHNWGMLGHAVMMGICLACFSDAIAMSIGLRLAEGAPRHQTTCQKVKGGLQVAALFAGTTGFSCFIESPALPTYAALPCFLVCGLLTYTLYGTKLVRRTEATVSALRSSRSSRSTRCSRTSRSQLSTNSDQSIASSVFHTSMPVDEVSTKDSEMHDIASGNITVHSHSIMAPSLPASDINPDSERIPSYPTSPPTSPKLRATPIGHQDSSIEMGIFPVYSASLPILENTNTDDSSQSPEPPLTLKQSIAYIELRANTGLPDVCHLETQHCMV